MTAERSRTIIAIQFYVENEGYHLYSEDAVGMHGEGATEEECTASFVGLVELFLQEKNGRIRETNTPAEKQLQLLEESLLKYWKEDGVVVLETKVREINVTVP